MIQPYDFVNNNKLFAKINENILKLDWNEYQYDFPEDLLNELVEKINNFGISMYSPTVNHELINLIVNHYRIQFNDFCLTSGVDDALNIIVNLFLKENDKVLIFGPTYDYFRFIVEMKGAIPNFVFPNVIFDEIRKQKLLERIDTDKEFKMVYLANPNNPTGTLYSRKAIEEIIELFPNSIIVVDETYIEFVDNYETAITLNHKNLLVCRSFSKFYGIAGARLGIVKGNQDLIQKIKQNHNSKSINVFAHYLGEIVLKNFLYFESNKIELRNTKRLIKQFVEANNLCYNLQEGNFFLLQCKNMKNRDKLFDELIKSNIIVRKLNINPFPLIEFVRITIPKGSKLPRLFEALIKNIRFLKRYQN